MSKPTLYHFGCSTQVGHHWHSSEWVTVYRPSGIPERICKAIDNAFMPDEAGWQHSQIGEGWFYIMSAKDNLIDTRPASHSTFIGYGFASATEFEAACRKEFPAVFKRIEEGKR